MNHPAVHPPPDAELVHRMLAERTAEVEQRVREAHRLAFDSALAGTFAVVAIGGFGRGELFPHSDVDLLLLSDAERNTPSREEVSGFLLSLTDAGMRPSQQVRSLAECVVEHPGNTEFSISLLDHRFVCGAEELYRDFAGRFDQFRLRRGPDLARKLVNLAEERRAKQRNSIYHLEPNIKEFPGGFRDIQTTRWLHQLEPHGSLPDLSEAFDFLAGLRMRMHEITGRDHNLLTFDMQDALSEDPASLMRGYYAHARHATRTVRRAMEKCSQRPETLLGRFQSMRSRLSTADFTVSRDRVLLRAHRPPIDLSLFEFVARHGLRLAADTIERLDGFVPEADWQDWERLLSLPRPSTGLRAMQESGVLEAAIPEWRHIECLVVRDFYHRYTVDEHALVAVTALERIADDRFVELMEAVGEPASLRFAVLLHELGKGSGSDASQASAALAREVLQRLGAPPEAVESVDFLIRNHLLLSQVMRSRDIYEEATARELASAVGTVERLKLLTMMTYADISAVNPDAMTPWRLEQLWQVYMSAYEELTRELVSDRIHTSGKLPPEQAGFLEGLPARYLRTHSREDMDAHLAMARQLHSRTMAIEIRPQRGYYRMTLLTKDRPALFASVAGALSSFGLNIVKAEAFSNAIGIVVDSFTFADPQHNLELNPSEIERLRGVVRKVVEGRQDVSVLLRGRPQPRLSRRMRVPPKVAVRNDASPAATLIEIAAADRPGLLYDLGNVLSNAGCNIEVVMIDTEAHRALDVFYVTREGAKLADAMQDELKAELVAACMGPQ